MKTTNRPQLIAKLTIFLKKSQTLEETKLELELLLNLLYKCRDEKMGQWQQAPLALAKQSRSLGLPTVA